MATHIHIHTTRRTKDAGEGELIWKKQPGGGGFYYLVNRRGTPQGVSIHQEKNGTFSGAVRFQTQVRGKSSKEEVSRELARMHGLDINHSFSD